MALQRRVAVVEYSDGRVERYRVTPRVDAIFERTYRTGLNTAFTGDGGATNIYRLAWEAMRAASNGAVVSEFETWLDSLEAVTVDSENVVPFVAGGTDTSSPTSPSPQG